VDTALFQDIACDTLDGTSVIWLADRDLEFPLSIELASRARSVRPDCARIAGTFGFTTQVWINANVLGPRSDSKISLMFEHVSGRGGRYICTFTTRYGEIVFSRLYRRFSSSWNPGSGPSLALSERRSKRRKRTSHISRLLRPDAESHLNSPNPIRSRHLFLGVLASSIARCIVSVRPGALNSKSCEPRWEGDVYRVQACECSGNS
jgi:hypothetical protein